MCFVIKTRFFSNDPEFRNIWKFDLVNGFAIWDFKNHSGQMRPLDKVREEPKEDGEIQDTVSTKRSLLLEKKLTLPNIPPVTQQDAHSSNINVVEVNARSVEMESDLNIALADVSMNNGLEVAQEPVETGKCSLDNEVMEVDETGINVVGNEGFGCDDDDLQNLTDEELEEMDTSPEDAIVSTKGESQLGEAGDKGVLAADEEKKKGARKVLFNQTIRSA
ncbi:hypothetical protein HID58_074772 [Brassica napus]|uniref:Uncharacterized protein n=1 Tax=Brassica napus TaxID=3708 RepID=A0ABQ7YKX3_BRANA|nr:hypothetical protein HID58_074772 [Brassica napus]